MSNRDVPARREIESRVSNLEKSSMAVGLWTGFLLALLPVVVAFYGSMLVEWPLNEAVSVSTVVAIVLAKFAERRLISDE